VRRRSGNVFSFATQKGNSYNISRGGAKNMSVAPFG
jgi:hypothetical protein